LAAQVQRFGVLRHLESFERGVLDSADVLYFASFTFIFLFRTFRSLESRRWR
jgi:ABC-2 type transport system permease protein